MSDHLIFLGIIATCVIIVLWYVQNERLGTNGERGLLAIKPDPEGLDKSQERTGPSYRMKPRLARRSRDQRSIDRINNAELTPAYRIRDDTERALQRFRRQDETRYRVKDKLSYKGEKKAND